MTAVRRMAMLSIATSIVTLALKFGAYFLTGSVSLWSDALEAFVNLAAGLVALGALTLAEQPADERHAYGHDKAEYFSSGVEGALILVAAIAIIWSATERLLAPRPLEQLGLGMLIALLAAAANFITARVMLKVARQHDSITIEADAKHLLTDVWTTAGILAGLGVVVLAPQWAILDPLMAIAVALHILFTGFDLLRRSADGLMDVGAAGQRCDPGRDADPRRAAARRKLPCAAHAQGGRAAVSRVSSGRAGHAHGRGIARAVRSGRGGVDGEPRQSARHDPRRAPRDERAASVKRLRDA